MAHMHTSLRPVAAHSLLPRLRRRRAAWPFLPRLRRRRAASALSSATASAEGTLCPSPPAKPAALAGALRTELVGIHHQ